MASSRRRTPARLPVVLTRDEVASVLSPVEGIHALIGRLLYGTGMRIMECVRLRVKDIDFVRLEIVVREGKGAKDRVTMLPRSVSTAARAFGRVHAAHESDLRAGFGLVYLPHALQRKYPVRHAAGVGNMSFRRRSFHRSAQRH